jgi:hypothetical protein
MAAVTSRLESPLPVAASQDNSDLAHALDEIVGRMTRWVGTARVS